MDKILHIIYKMYTKIRPQKRLYQYGTIGLKIKDDRTLKEKFFDKIDEFFFNWQQNLRYKKAYRKQVFHSYFDFGLGKIVTSNEEIRKKERQGYTYTTFSEMERESERIKARIRKEQAEKTKKHFKEVVGKIKAGNSHYHQDLMEKMSKS